MHKECESVGALLAQVCRHHYSWLHALLEEIGLYRGQPQVLNLLWEEEGRTHSELAENLHVQPATISRMIQRMERAGFVERRPDEKDERVSRVYLTKAGREVRQDVQRILKETEEQTLAGLDADERSLLRRFLSQMRDNLLRAINNSEPTS